MTDDPDFFAWLDGELPEPHASGMAAKVAADPDLAAFAQQHRALGARLSHAFAPIAATPVPERLRTAAVPPTADVVDLFAARARRRRAWSIAGLAAAASLALGLTIGSALPRESGSFSTEGGTLAAAGPLDRALDRQSAAAGEQGGIRIGVSFKDRSGRYCRSFSTDAQSGLACRAGEAWGIEGLVSTQGSSGSYRMASGIDPALGAMVESRISERPLDSLEEAEAIESRWKS